MFLFLPPKLHMKKCLFFKLQKDFPVHSKLQAGRCFSSIRAIYKLLPHPFHLHVHVGVFFLTIYNIKISPTKIKLQVNLFFIDLLDSLLSIHVTRVMHTLANACTLRFLPLSCKLHVAFSLFQKKISFSENEMQAICGFSPFIQTSGKLFLLPPSYI